MRPTQLIFITRQDTIDTICALVGRARPGTQVWLVIPWRAGVLRGAINLKRLKRVSEDAAVDLRLVTRDRETRGLARDAGLAVHWGVPPSLRKHRPPQVHTTDLGRRVIPVDEPKSRRFYRRPRKLTLTAVFFSLLLIMVLFTALAGVVVFFMPMARVVLEPIASPHETAFLLHANPRYREIDFEDRVIPARSIQVIVEGQAQTPATGRKDVPDQHASGVIVLANRTERTITVPKGTVVRTSSGVTQRFYTTVDAELPPGLHSHVRIPIMAIEPGFVVAPPFTVNRLEGELAAQVEALNDVRIEGGGTRRVSVVAYADFDTLRTMLVELLQQEAYSRFVDELEPGEYVPAQSLNAQVMSLDYLDVVDQQVDMLSGRMRLVVSGLAIQDNDIRDLSRHLLVQQAGGESQAIEDSLQISRSGNIRVLEAGLEMDIQVQGLVTPMINMEAVQREIRGREIEDASTWLLENLSLRSAPQIELAPDLIHRMPMLAGRMEIVISSNP